MRVLKMSMVWGALAVLMVASPTFAQATPPQTAPPQTTPPPQTMPKPQTPPATAPAVQAPAAKPEPPVPFPQDSKFAFVDVNEIAANSVAGKAAAKKLQELGTKKQAEIADKTKQLQALTTKRDQGGAVLSESARAQIDKDIERLQRDIQFAQQNAQAEYQDLTNELQADFQKQLIPIIDEIAKEKGLYMIFTGESGFAYVNPGLNLSGEVVKRLDAKK